MTNHRKHIDTCFNSQKRRVFCFFKTRGEKTKKNDCLYLRKDAHTNTHTYTQKNPKHAYINLIPHVIDTTIIKNKKSGVGVMGTII
jgi:hypothetical protein